VLKNEVLNLSYWPTFCRECPADLKEGICSLIFAAPRCSELPELSRMRDLFEKKYGKDFVAAAVDLRPNAGVNNLVSVCIFFY
jgi:vacuolar protein sorting-associated protein IST1